MSLSELARWLTERGIRRRSGQAWTIAALHQLMTNPCYMGRGWYNRETSGSKRSGKKAIVRPAEEWIPIAYPPLVSAELFERVQEKFRANKTLRAGQPGDPAYILRGLLACGCGKRLQPRTVGRWRYYVCRKGCGFRVPAVDLEARVWEQVTATMQEPEVLVQKLQAQHRRLQVNEVEHQSALVVAEADVASVTARIRGVVDLLGTPDVPIEELRTRLRELELERRAKVQVRDEARAKVAPAPTPPATVLLAQAERLCTALHAPAARTPAGRAAILRRLVEAIRVKAGEQELEIAGKLYVSEDHSSATGACGEEMAALSLRYAVGFGGRRA